MIVASIDIGTNTILLLIAEVNTKTNELKVIENLYQIPRIGKGLKPGYPFPEDNVKRMFEVFIEYSKVIKKFKCDKVIVTGTNAFRIASNKEQIVKKIKKKFGYDLTVIPGQEEAKYSYLGATSNYQSIQKFLVIDIGGGSTEIIYGSRADISFCQSFPVGVVSGTENYFHSDPPSEEQVKNFIYHIEEIFWHLNRNIKDVDAAIAVAGTPTTLAAIKQKLVSYNEVVIEGSTLRTNELNQFISDLSKISSNEILNKFPVVKGREDVLLAGTIILKVILEILGIQEIKVSTKGIRFGAIINWLNHSTNSKT